MLQINRIRVAFDPPEHTALTLKKIRGPVLCSNRARWVSNHLTPAKRTPFLTWLGTNGMTVDDRVETVFDVVPDSETAQDSHCTINLSRGEGRKFAREMLRSALGQHLMNKGYLVQVGRLALDISVFIRCEDEAPREKYEVYERLDLRWHPRRGLLTVNIGSEFTLISRVPTTLQANDWAYDSERKLVYRVHEGTSTARYLCPREEWRRLRGSPTRCNYAQRHKALRHFVNKSLVGFQAPHFVAGEPDFIAVKDDDVNRVRQEANLMCFGDNVTSPDTVVGMRRSGPWRIPKTIDGSRFLFVYPDRDLANKLFRYLDRGCGSFPGIEQYAGIPLELAEPKKGLLYRTPSTLAPELIEFLDQHFSDCETNNLMGLIIGNFSKFPSSNEDRQFYYRIKEILINQGITSQFITPDTINSEGVRYALPNRAIGMLAKLGGIPWKLAQPKQEELVVGFNVVHAEGGKFTGSAVFFDDEGRLGRVAALEGNDSSCIVDQLQGAIEEFKATGTGHDGEANNDHTPSKIVIHYYKPASHGEVKGIEDRLQQMELNVPIAVVEINDAKSRLDLCFDTEFGMGMPKSGTYVTTGTREYLLFNNERFGDQQIPRLRDEYPLKVRLSYVDESVFTCNDLISQVYQFSFLHWKSLRQKRVPVTTLYAKRLAELAAHFDGPLPTNLVATTTPWFI